MYGALSAGTGCTTVPTADMTAEDEEEGEEEGEKKGEEEEGEGDKYHIPLIQLVCFLVCTSKKISGGSAPGPPGSTLKTGLRPVSSPWTNQAWPNRDRNSSMSRCTQLLLVRCTWQGVARPRSSVSLPVQPDRLQ